MNQIEIKNFNLSLFKNLLNQSLIVTTQLMLEFNNDMLKSCSFSQTKSLIKLWTIPNKDLIIKPKNIESQPSEILNLDVETLTDQEYQDLKIPDFNFYILKGDLFRNYISVFSGDSVDLIFNLVPSENDKLQASSIIINGKSESGSPLKIEFVLTTEEMISNKISDYSEILKQCTPSKEMFEFVIINKQVTEIRGLIKKLHKSIVDNTSFLTFTLTKNKIIVNDKIFKLEFENDNSKNITNNDELLNPIVFNILKSDFLIIGDHTFSIFTTNELQKIIFGSKYGQSLIWCMSTKIDNSISLDNDDDNDDIDSLSISQYIDDFDLEGE